MYMKQTHVVIKIIGSSSVLYLDNKIWKI